MTPEIIRRRIGALGERHADRRAGPLQGRPRGAGDAAGRAGASCGPEELKDLPEFFGGKASRRDLTGHDCRIFAEIVEALGAGRRGDPGPRRGAARRGCGRDRPGLPARHALSSSRGGGAGAQGAGLAVSVDSGDPGELRRGARAGADFLLSLTEDDAGSRLRDRRRAGADPGPPRRAGRPGPSLRAAAARPAGRSSPTRSSTRSISASPTSIVRYHELRRRLPEVEMLMGVGNLTELTDADTTGITMMLMGMVSELAIRNILVVQVSPHCRGAVREAELARRILYRRQGRRQPAAGLRPGPAGAARPAPVPQHARPRSRRARPRSATPTSGSRSPRTACMSTIAMAIMSRAIRSTCSRSWASSRTARMPSISASSWPGRRWRISWASATSRTTSCAGAGGAPAGRGSGALRPGRQHAGGAPQGPPARER